VAVLHPPGEKDVLFSELFYGSLIAEYKWNRRRLNEGGMISLTVSSSLGLTCGMIP
jgi:hypothetical protein